MNMNLPVNWFDILLIVMLFIGVQRGRKHGMSQEAMAMLGWVAVVLVSAIAYEPLGLWISATAGMNRLPSYLIAYFGTALVVAGVFVHLKRVIGARLAGSDAFGKAEYYLGMPAGAVRFACILLAALALLNARLYRTAEIKAMAKAQEESYGSQFFPTLQTVQAGVFEESFSGRYIRKHLGFLLIKPTYSTAPATGSASTR
jgi:uncharacterized membrane protein required for colicin V production